MQFEHNHASPQPTEKIARPDPSGFVMSVALTLFALTIVAVITMHYAVRFNWQVL